jgi:hypothetical protein
LKLSLAESVVLRYGTLDVDQELLKLGIAGLVCVVLWVMLMKSEKREEKKDARIQMLENQLIESYDERIAAADRIAEAIHDSANASNNAAKTLDDLILELRTKARHG